MNRVGITGLSALAVISFAHAATQTGASGATELQEVVVTAEKISQSLEKLPLSVTVFDQEALRRLGAQSFLDYAANVPALSFESLAPGEQRILLRGVSDGVDTGLRAATQNVTGIYIDDMVVSNNETAPDLNLFDVQRVEVLKGPQGTLYGDGAVGGLVRVITNKANVDKTEGAIEVSGAGIDHGGGDYSVNGMYNLPLVADQLAVRLVGQYRDNQGFIDDVTRNVKDVNDLRQVGLRAAVRWTPREDFDLNLSALYQETRLGGDNDYNQLLGDLKRGTFFGEPKDTRFNLYNMTVNWNLGWATLLSSTSYSVYDHDDTSDFTDFLTTAIAGSFGVPGVVLPSHGEQRQHDNDFSEEIRLSSASDGPVTWIGGLYFFHMNERSFEHDISVGLFDFFANVLDFPLAGTPLDAGHDVAFTDQFSTQRRQFATFGEVSFHFSEQLTGTVGARWFRDQIASQDSPAGVFNGGSDHESQETSDHNQIFRFRLADQMTDDALVYALASQGYRTGGLNPLNPATATDPTFPQAFGPDKLWNYELGWKTRWLDHRLTLNGSVFYVDWSNEQIEVALPGGFDVIANAGKTSIKGTEWDLSMTPISGLELGINGSYIHAILARDLVNNTDPANPIVIGRSGDALTGVPKTQGSVYGQWQFPFTDSVAGFLRSDVQYVGRTTRYFAHDSRVPAPADNFQDYGDYTLINVRTGAQWKDFTVTLFVKNAADRRAAFFRGLQGTSTVPTRDDVYVAQPRTIGITVYEAF
jgi:iron complex outermembrane recepter protein